MSGLHRNSDFARCLQPRTRDPTASRVFRLYTWHRRGQRKQQPRTMTIEIVFIVQISTMNNIYGPFVLLYLQ